MSSIFELLKSQDEISQPLLLHTTSSHTTSLLAIHPEMFCIKNVEYDDPYEGSDTTSLGSTGSG